MSEKKKIILVTGKRKDSVARGMIYPGTGKVKINGKDLSTFSEIQKLSISEPLLIAGDHAKKYDIYVNVKSGGIYGQVDAIRQAIAKCLASAEKSLKAEFVKYDRSLLVSDVRRNEPHKPGPSKPRKHKQRSKR